MKIAKWLLKVLRGILMIVLCLVLLCVTTVLLIDLRITAVGKAHLLTAEEAATLEDVDCIIVLGCQVHPDGSLSDMLQDRLIRSLELYNAGVAPKILMSGDHGDPYYNEVGAMKSYAVENGVPSEDVFMDHAGFSTYETVYRAKEIFQAKKVVIVTQGYHLHRALYIAKRLGLEAYGVASDLRTYRSQSKQDVRESLARCKAFAMCIFKPEPTYLGDVIPIDGDGNVTNDKPENQTSR